MRLIDTHCHLDFPEFASDLDDVLRRAAAEGVSAVITVGTSVESSRRCVELAHRYPGVFASVGVHPSEATSSGASAFKELKALLRDGKVVAVGETGLDYHYGRDCAQLQKEMFRHHLALAADAGLPVIVHQRESARDVMEILDTFPSRMKVVFHCFGGDTELAAFCKEKGYFVSFAGILTFSNAESVRAVAREFPLDGVLIETDAPYLSPAPLRGRRNEPGRVRLVLEKLSALRSLDCEECAERLWSNASAFFGLPLDGGLLG